MTPAEQGYRKTFKWNYEVIALMGFTYKKQDDQTASFTLYQGEMIIFHDYNYFGGFTGKEKIHNNLQLFLISYLKEYLKFEFVKLEGPLEQKIKNALESSKK